MGDTTKLALGPCNVSWNGVDVGFIHDGVTIEIESMSADLTASQLGTTPVDKVITGVAATVTVPLAEITLEAWKLALANAVDLVDDTTPTKRRLEVRPQAGLSLQSIAAALVITPILGGVATTDKEKICTVPKAAPDATTVSMSFGNDDQRRIEAKFVCLPDTALNNYRLLYFGDSTAIDANEGGFTP